MIFTRFIRMLDKRFDRRGIDLGKDIVSPQKRLSWCFFLPQFGLLIWTLLLVLQWISSPELTSFTKVGILWGCCFFSIFYSLFFAKVGNLLSWVIALLIALTGLYLCRKIPYNNCDIGVGIFGVYSFCAMMIYFVLTRKIPNVPQAATRQERQKASFKKRLHKFRHLRSEQRVHYFILPILVIIMILATSLIPGWITNQRRLSEFRGLTSQDLQKITFRKNGKTIEVVNSERLRQILTAMQKGYTFQVRGSEMNRSLITEVILSLSNGQTIELQLGLNQRYPNTAIMKFRFNQSNIDYSGTSFHSRVLYKTLQPLLWPEVTKKEARE